MIIEEIGPNPVVEFAPKDDIPAPFTDNGRVLAPGTKVVLSDLEAHVLDFPRALLFASTVVAAATPCRFARIRQVAQFTAIASWILTMVGPRG